MGFDRILGTSPNRCSSPLDPAGHQGLRDPGWVGGTTPLIDTAVHSGSGSSHGPVLGISFYKVLESNRDLGIQNRDP